MLPSKTDAYIIAAPKISAAATRARSGSVSSLAIASPVVTHAPAGAVLAAQELLLVFFL